MKQSGAKKYIKMEMNFDIEYPKTAQESMELETNNGSTLWNDVIAKDMRSVQVAFDTR